MVHLVGFTIETMFTNLFVCYNYVVCIMYKLPTYVTALWVSQHCAVGPCTILCFPKISNELTHSSGVLLVLLRRCISALTGKDSKDFSDLHCIRGPELLCSQLAKKFPPTFRNLMVHSLVYISPPLVRFLSYMNPVHVL